MWGEGEGERQASVTGAEKIRLSMVTHGAGEGSGCQALDGLPCHTGDLYFLRSALFKVLTRDDVRSLWQSVNQHCFFHGDYLAIKKHNKRSAELNSKLATYLIHSLALASYFILPRKTCSLVREPHSEWLCFRENFLLAVDDGSEG